MRWVIALGLVLLFRGGIAPAAAQELQTKETGPARDIPCAEWLRDPTDTGKAAWKLGYAVAIISVVDRELLGKKESSIRDGTELVVGITSVCAGTPQKRLIDVALYLLGAR